MVNMISAYAIVFIHIKKASLKTGWQHKILILLTCRRGSNLRSEGLLGKLEVSTRYLDLKGEIGRAHV